MTLDNVQLWFAKNKDNKIVTINEVDKENKDKYYCPLCNSEVLARQGKINSWCFAHIDKSKCSSESMYHFWIKNKLLQKGDRFKIQTDIEKEYICDDILVEETYKIGDKEYRPDLTVKTTEGDIIYFEMNYTNEKKLEDYLDIWIELGNIVVEVDVKTLINSESGELPIFKAKYYNGKCFNVKKGEDKIYYETIGQHKEKLIKNNEYDNEKKKEIEKLDWFWKDVQRYKMNEINIEHISELIQSIEDKDSKDIIVDILKKSSCQNIIKKYVDINIKKFSNKIRNIKTEINTPFSYSIVKPHYVHDRVYGKYMIYISYQSDCMSFVFSVVSKDVNKLLVEIKNTLKAIKEKQKRAEIEKRRLEKDEKKKEILRNLQNFKIPLDYSNLCDYIDDKCFPKINYWKQSRLYLNDFKHSFDGYYITKNNFTDENKANELMLKVIGDYEEYFSKEEIVTINNICRKMKNKYGDKLYIKIDEGCLLKIKYKNRIIFENYKNDFYISDLYKVIPQNIKIYKNKKALEMKQEKEREYKWEENYFKRLRGCKLDIISQLKKDGHNILNIYPMCNKPYLVVKHYNNMKNIIFLSKEFYQENYSESNKYDIVTVLNKENKWIGDIDFKFEILNRILIKNNDDKIRFFKKYDLFDYIIFNDKDLVEKNINIFYYKNRPQNQRYKNLNEFNFVKSFYKIKNMNQTLIKIKMIDLCFNNFDISDNKIINQESITKMRDLILCKMNDSIGEFIYNIKKIKNKNINFLFNIKHTIEESRGYKPWLIEDFINELYNFGFKNVNIKNIQSEEDWNDK